MYQRMLAAVDGSEASLLALQEASKLAREVRARLRLVHVVDVMPHGVAVAAPEELGQAIRNEGNDILKAAADLVQAAGVEAETVLLEADWRHFGRAIVEEAKDWQADLIVMGTHGHTALVQLVLGSVAEGVIRRAPVPVLLVRGHHDPCG